MALNRIKSAIHHRAGRSCRQSYGGIQGDKTPFGENTVAALGAELVSDIGHESREIVRKGGLPGALGDHSPGGACFDAVLRAAGLPPFPQFKVTEFSVTLVNAW